ncbi:large ribosomal subunit protein bL9m-like [Saccostrea echinata]|uniref:large ribosomal subunit protein bL9m-like n=1 Tax=Saccostrea echinata TaxID=191078 RepID=UPI002A800951|nr:large ribosomal subunit protein bL9m-like [Saccostrea echinata]
MIGCSQSRTVCKQLMNLPQIAQQKFLLNQIRSLHMVERVRTVILHKDDRKPKIRGRHYIYRNIENPNPSPAEIDVLLTDHVDGLGIMGDIVTVPKRLWRNFLYQAQLATYPTPENIVELSHEMQALGDNAAILKQLGKFSRITLQKIRGLNLPVELMPSKTGWTLTKGHIRIALRKVGIAATEDSITLPEDPEMKTPGVFIFTITMNEAVSLKVRGTLVERPLVFVEESPADKIQVWNNPPVTPDEELNPVIRKFLTTPAIDIDAFRLRPPKKPKVRNPNVDKQILLREANR